ncbi:MAG: tetratricopeptide repeat protein, partial [Acidimicrobiales bacterium]
APDGERPGSPSPGAAGVAGAPRGRRPRSALQRWSLAGAIVAFVVVAGVLVGTYAAQRRPGQQVSGSVSPPTTQAGSQQVAKELVRGRLLASQGHDVAAAKVFSQVLSASPRQPEALAYEGWLLRQAGVAGHSQKVVDEGRALVARAVAVDPSYPDAHVFLGYMLLQDEHDPSGAVAQFRLFLGDHPTPALVRRTAPAIAQAYSAVHQPVPAQVAGALSQKARPAS